jgi:hypothetical protein
MPPVPDPASLRAIRAACETIVPSTELMPGAADLGVDRHVVALLELSLPGLVDMVAALLDATAAEVRPAASFADLSLEERSRALRAMSTDESQDVRDVVDALLLFTLGGTFSEWTGYDRATGRLEPPVAWRVLGFAGPVAGHPAYREET